MRNQRLVALQRETIDELEHEIEMLKKENELFKKYNERLENEMAEIKNSYMEAMEQYGEMMAEMKKLSEDAKDTITSTVLEKKERKKEFNSLMKEINRSKKKVPMLCSSCGEKLTDDYVFQNGCYICIHCWDGGAV